MSFFGELKRRNVFRVGLAYAVGAWVLLQIVDFVLDAISAPNWILQVFILVAAVGLPVALIISWVYEMTPEGIRRESEIDRSKSITPNTGRKLDRVISVFLAVAVIILLADRFISTDPVGGRSATDAITESANAPVGGRSAAESSAQSRAESAPANTEQSLAVLPFVNMSSDPDNEYFSDGISEELLNLLVQVDGLRVPSRTSSFAFKGQNTDIREIARQLGVSHILEGSVRKASNRVRVTAQLIDVSTDTHLWSEIYDRELEDIFAIQDEIARNIMQALRVALAPGTGENKPTEDLEAYQEYLRGRYLFIQRGLNSLNLSLESLQTAVARDPEFVEAWAALCQTAATLTGWDPENADRYNAIAAEAGEQALQLDADSPAARAGMALVAFNLGDWSRALDTIEQAAARSKDSTPVYWQGLMLQASGYLEEARSRLQAAEKIDPVYPQLQNWLGLNALALGDLALAEKHFQRTLDGGNPNGISSMMWVKLSQGDPESATRLLDDLVRSAEKGNTVGPLTREHQRAIAVAFNNPALRPAAIKPAREAGSVFVLSWLEAYPEIMDILHSELEQGEKLTAAIEMGTTIWSPDLKPVRQMPEFKQFLRDFGLVDLWKTRGWPDLCRPLGEGDLECD